MNQPPISEPAPLTTTQCAVVCAVAAQLQRDLQSRASAAGTLFAARPFDPAMLGSFALALAFSSPRSSAAQLKTTGRACLWSIGVDWLIDYAATSREQVDAVVNRCLAVADGAPAAGGDDVAEYLSEIRDDILAGPGHAVLGDVWRDELRRMLAAMAREWEWNAARRSGEAKLPSVEDYLNNADNTGFCFVFASYWSSAGDVTTLHDAGEVMAAARCVQQAVRLLNDLGSQQRDNDWGDLNVLNLGLTRSEVKLLVADLGDSSRQRLAPLQARHPDLTDYMQRQLDFCAGFYRIHDFWGSL